MIHEDLITSIMVPNFWSDSIWHCTLPSKHLLSGHRYPHWSSREPCKKLSQHVASFAFAPQAHSNGHARAPMDTPGLCYTAISTKKKHQAIWNISLPNCHRKFHMIPHHFFRKSNHSKSHETTVPRCEEGSWPNDPKICFWASWPGSRQWIHDGLVGFFPIEDGISFQAPKLSL